MVGLNSIGCVEKYFSGNKDELHDHVPDFCGQREVTHWLLLSVAGDCYHLEKVRSVMVGKTSYHIERFPRFLGWVSW